MFTGIVEEIGVVKAIIRDRMTIKAEKIVEGMQLGDSVSVNGVCLTVTELKNENITVQLMPETKRITGLSSVRIQDNVNLERAMSAMGRFGGHFVQGHVDGVGKLMKITPDQEALILKFTASREICQFIVKKCFIAVNGVSLTITECDEDSFCISLVSFTKNNTNLGLLKPGESVNLEVDILAKYIKSYIQNSKNGSLSGLLERYDYLKVR